MMEHEDKKEEQKESQEMSDHDMIKEVHAMLTAMTEHKDEKKDTPQKESQTSNLKSFDWVKPQDSKTLDLEDIPV